MTQVSGVIPHHQGAEVIRKFRRDWPTRQESLVSRKNLPDTCRDRPALSNEAELLLNNRETPAEILGSPVNSRTV